MENHKLGPVENLRYWKTDYKCCIHKNMKTKVE